MLCGMIKMLCERVKNLNLLETKIMGTKINLPLLFTLALCWIAGETPLSPNLILERDDLFNNYIRYLYKDLVIYK